MYDVITPNPIIVTGAARSGTSMTTGVLHICGAWIGQTTGPTRYNRLGQFENDFIRDRVVKPYLRTIGADPMGQNPLPDIEKLKIEAAKNAVVWRREICDVMATQKYPGDIPWLYKGAKACIMWPIWNAAFPEARWIIVRRDAEDIIRSCLKTAFMRAYRTRSGWLGWLAEHEKRFEEMHDAKLSIQEVWPQRMINGDLTQVQMVVNNLGLTWRETTIREFISPALWHRWAGKKLREDDGESSGEIGRG